MKPDIYRLVAFFQHVGPSSSGTVLDATPAPMSIPAAPLPLPCAPQTPDVPTAGPRPTLPRGVVGVEVGGRFEAGSQRCSLSTKVCFCKRQLRCFSLVQA